MSPLSRRPTRWRSRWPFLSVAALAIAACGIRIWANRGVAAPQLLCDEFIYADLARNFSSHGRLLLRGDPSYQSILYPILIAPAWVLAHSISAVYTLVKSMNVVFMTLSVVPTYLWARRLVTPPFAVIASALILLMPWFLYTGMILSESAAFSGFVLASFAIGLAIERPTLLRQAAALAAIAITIGIRVQALVLVPILFTSVLLKLVLDQRAWRGSEPGPRTRWRALGQFWFTFVLVTVSGVVYMIVELIRGRALSSGLGPYENVAVADYNFGAVAHWTLLHLAELVLSVAIVPASALIVLLGQAVIRGEPSVQMRAFLAVATAVVAWVSLEAGMFASQFVDAVVERYSFYAAPLLLLALAAWLGRGLPRPPRLTAIAAFVPVLGVMAFPLSRFLNPNLLPNSPSLYGFFRLEESISGGGARVEQVVTVVAVVSAAIVAFGSKRLLLVAIPAGVAAFFALSAYPAFGVLKARSLPVRHALGIDPNPGWVDDALGSRRDARFLYVTTPATKRETSTVMLQTAFWNRDVHSVINLGISELCPLPETSARVDRYTGVLAWAGGRRVRVRYFITDSSLGLAGKVLARQPPFVLVDTEGSARLSNVSEGVYADGWMGSDATFTHYGAVGNRYGAVGNRHPRLMITLSRTGWTGADVPGHVTIRLGPLVLDAQKRPRIAEITSERRFVIHSGTSRGFSILAPTPPFRVEVHVEPTFSPAQYGSADSRQLGAQVSFGVASG